MLVQINNDFEVESDSNQWKLHQYVDGINPKTKEPTRTKKTTYHGRLDQALTSALDKNLKDHGTICDLLVAIDDFKCEVIEAVKSLK